MIPIHEIQRRMPSGSVKSWAVAALCGLIFCAASPSVSFAAQKPSCEFTILDGSSKGREGEAKIEISGDTLKWFVQSPVPFLPKPKISYIEAHYKILEIN